MIGLPCDEKKLWQYVKPFPQNTGTWQTDRQNCYINKCIGDDTKAAARQSLNCIKNKKNKIWRKTIFSMPDEIFTPCNVTCGSGIVTVNSPNGSTLQCDMWLWDDMPLNSPKRPPYWNSTSGFHFHTSPQSTCHSVPVCEILSKSDHPRQKNDVMSIFKMAVLAILDCRVQ